MRKILAGILTICISALTLTGCGQTSLYTDAGSAYKTVTDVPGISFAVPSSVTMATAINRIASDMEFDTSTTYSYKDGTKTYLVFNMENIVILVEKGTHFGFDMIPDGEDKSRGLSTSPIISTWLSQTGKNFSYAENVSDGVYKLIADVNAQVSITTRVFGDFTGQLAVVTDRTTEYALFIGAPTDLYGQLGSEAENIIGTVAKSLKMTYVEERTSDMESIEDDAYEKTVTAIIANEDSADEVVTEEEETIEASSEEPVSTEETSVSLDESVITTEPSEESVVSEEPLEEETAEDEIIEETDDGSLNLDNQNNTAIESEGSFYSNVYSALKVGDAGKFMALNGNGKSKQAVITINRLLTKDEAEAEIKRYASSGKSAYSYTAAPEGCHYEAVEYTLDNGGSGESVYANIKFAGLDGEKLYFKGIGYTTRTYDILDKTSSQNGVTTGCICYYAVPNGCSEYMLVVGDGTKDMGVSMYNAYYSIKADN